MFTVSRGALATETACLGLKRLRRQTKNSQFVSKTKKKKTLPVDLVMTLISFAASFFELHRFEQSGGVNFSFHILDILNF
jgi:hypothetical protein